MGTRDRGGTAHDWGFSLQPASQLSEIALVGLGVGNSEVDPSTAANTSPVFVTVLAATNLQVDRDGDGVVDQVIPMTRLQSVRIIDDLTNDGDNSAMRLFTDNGELISVAWGENGNAPLGSPGFDAGTTVPAVPVPEFFKFSEFAPGGDVNGDGFFNEGDVIRYTLRIRHIGQSPITNAVLTDILPSQVTYIAGSTIITTFDPNTGPTSIPDSGTGTPFPLDGSGYTIASIVPNETIFVRFDAQINTGLPAGFNFILNQSVLTFNLFRLPANDVIDLRGTVGDFVWFDVNGDGIQDPGEPGIAGATVTLTWLGEDGVAGGTGKNADVTYTATTDANGKWFLTNLPAGKYTTAVSGIPNGLTAQTAGPATFNLPAGQVSIDNLDFGYTGTGTIGDFVFNDLDGNGIQDSGETGVTGATVTLTWAGFNGSFGDADDITYPSVVTPASGKYSFTDLPSGNFRLLFTPPTGGTRSPANQGSDDTIDSDADPVTGLTGVIALAAGATNNTVDAGMQVTADLQITKTNNVTSVIPGTTVTYTIVVTNAGPLVVAGATVTDLIPTALTGVTWTSVTAGGATVTSGATGNTNNLSSTVNLPVGGTVTYTVSGTLSPSFTGTLENTANVAAPAGITDPDTTNNSDTDSDPAAPTADLRITKTDGDVTVEPGDTITYTLTVLNQGPSTSGVITLTDTLPANTSFQSASNSGTLTSNTVTWILPASAPGDSTSVTVTVVVDAAVPAGLTEVTNSATVSSPVFDPDLSNNHDSDNTPIDAVPDLVVVKSDGGVSTIPGGIVVYTIRVTNVGNQDATGVVLSETVPTNATFVAGQSSPGWNGAGTSFTIGSLAAGDFVDILYAVQVDDPLPAGIGQISNTASATDDGTNGFDPTPANNSSTDTTPVANGRIGDRVFLDVNGNGVDDGEPGVEGITVELIDAATEVVIDSVLTDASGNYQFVNVPPGEYRVRFGNSDGTTNYTFTLPNQGVDDTIDSDADQTTGKTPSIFLTAGQQLSTVDAGVYVPVTIGDRVYYDLNADGIQDVGELGIVGATVEVIWLGPDGVLDTGPGGDDVTFTTTTGADGIWSIGSLPPGSFQVTVTPPVASGSSQTTDSIDNANLDASNPVTISTTSGINRDDADFGFIGAGSIGDRIFLDLNGNDQWDAGEGLNCVTVTLIGDLNGDGTPDTLTTQTTTDGFYEFTNLPVTASGVSYTIVVTPSDLPQDASGNPLANSVDPDGATPNQAIVVLDSVNSTITDIDFGYTGPGVIGDVVFLDVNGNGIADPGEGISGVTVTLTADSDVDGANETVTAVTDSQGNDAFANLPVFDPNGDPIGYLISVDPSDLPSGVTNTADPDGGVASQASLTLVGNPVREDIDCGYRGPGVIGDRIFLDLNDDGVWDAGEGLSGVTVTLMADVNGDGTNEIFTVVTDPDGFYEFTGLPVFQQDGSTPVSYEVTVTAGLPSGVSNSTDPDTTLDSSTTLTLVGNDSRTDIDFGYQGAGSIGDRVWIDANGDGIQGPLSLEPGLPGVELAITYAGQDGIFGTADDVTSTTSGGQDGSYAFQFLPEGMFQITPVGANLPDNVVATTDKDDFATAIDGLANVVLGIAETRTDVDFGYRGIASIGDRVYIDQNGNGLDDASPFEPGIPGATVDLLWAGPDGTLDTADDVTFSTTTDSNGNYNFPGLPVYGSDDPYRVTVTVPTSGFVPTADVDDAPNTPAIDGVAQIVLAATATRTDVDFGYDGDSTLSGSVFNDLNNNGVRDVGEPGIPGVTVRLTGTDVFGRPIGNPDTGNAEFLAITDANGDYSFTTIVPGTYTLTEVNQPEGYNDGLDTTGSLGGTDGNDVLSGISVTGGSTGTDYVFGERGVVIAGTVFRDDNRDGTQDAGEPGLAGVTMTLLDADGNPVDDPNQAGFQPYVVGTGPDGSYQFANVPFGDYQIVETQPAGFGNSPVGPATVVDVSVPATGLSGVNFGEILGSLAGEVFLDSNSDGVRDPGEFALSGVRVALTGTDEAGNLVTRMTTTGADGSYLFDLLPAGTYTITELQPAGYFDGDDTLGTVDGEPSGTAGNDVFSGITLAGGATGVDYVFAEQSPNAPELNTTFIAGTVFNDPNQSGVLDPGETGIPGVTVELQDASGTVLQTTTTGPAGEYLFLNVAPGTYTVVQPTQPAALSSTSPDSIPVTIPDTLTPAPNLNFGESAGFLTGTVFLDLDGNGNQDAGEPGLGGVTLTLTGTDIDGNPVSLTTTTGLDGTYRFMNLPQSDAAGYTLTETQPTGFDDGQDTLGTAGGTLGNDTVTGIVLPALGSGMDYIFAELPPSTAPGTGIIAGTVFVDDNRDGILSGGETCLGGVTVELVDAGGNVVDSVVTNPDGSYLFTGVTPAVYTVREVQPAVYGSSTPNLVPITVPNVPNPTPIVGVNFGETLGSVSGSVFNDFNDNGVRDPGEPGIGGVTVTLEGTDASENPVSLTTTTDADGNYTFTAVPAGNYTVSEPTQPVGYAHGTDTAGTAGGNAGNDVISDIVIVGGVEASGYTFAERGVNSVSGTFYLDYDMNAVLTPGPDSPDRPIPGARVILIGIDAMGNSVTLSTLTDADGVYTFEYLGAGTYRIIQNQEQLPTTALPSDGVYDGGGNGWVSWWLEPSE